MGLNIGGAITGGLTGFAAGGPAGAALGAIGGGLFSPETPTAPQVQFNPADITSGFGSVTFDKDTGFTTSLDPRLKAIQGSLFGAGTGFLNQLKTFDPDVFAGNVTQRLRNLAAPQEEKARLGLENRLFQQGLLTSTTGAGRFGELLSAQALADEARVARGFSLGQDVQGNLLSRGMSALQGGINLEQLPIGLLEASLASGRGALGASEFNAANLFETSKLRADERSALLSSGLSALGGMDFGGLFSGSNSTGRGAARIDPSIFSSEL